MLHCPSVPTKNENSDDFVYALGGKDPRRREREVERETPRRGAMKTRGNNAGGNGGMDLTSRGRGKSLCQLGLLRVRRAREQDALPT